MDKKPVSVPEAFDILSSAELTDERQNEILAYTEKFHHITPKDARKAMKDLKKLTDASDIVIVKLIDLAPRTKEELTSILAPYNVSLSEEKLNSVLDYFSGLLD